jgi:hypothetical protein
MATLPRKHAGAPKTPLSTFSVSIALVIETEIGVDELQDLSVAVQEAVDALPSDAIIGCATSGTFAPAVIDLDVDILAVSQAALYEQITSIMVVLEKQCSLKFVAGDTHIERADDRELVPA